MVFRGHHAICDYVSVVQNGQGARALCVCPKRFLSAPGGAHTSVSGMRSTRPRTLS
jgi:hypothetical protein